MAVRASVRPNEKDPPTQIRRAPPSKDSGAFCVGAALTRRGLAIKRLAKARMARAALRLTVRDVEKLTGVNKNTVSRYEAGCEILVSALGRSRTSFASRGWFFRAKTFVDLA